MLISDKFAAIICLVLCISGQITAESLKFRNKVGNKAVNCAGKHIVV